VARHLDPRELPFSRLRAALSEAGAVLTPGLAAAAP
jgi:hypothetical protein